MARPIMLAEAGPQGVSQTYLDELIEAGLLIETGVDGLYGRAGVFEEVIDRFEALISGFAAADRATAIHFPPAMSRAHFETSGYLKSFPQLAGTVHSFMGDTKDHQHLLGLLERHEDWTGQQLPTDLVLTPAACYPLYPVIARGGPLAPEGVLYDLKSYCFRHEPSRDPARMQMFRMREFVRVGSPDDVQAFRARWLERGQALIGALALPCKVDLANDPFFGRTGRMLAVNQRDQGLKFELLIPVADADKPTACLSFNYHQDHFGATWGIKRHDGSTAHSACVGFGLERVALALFRHHGTSLKRWPSAVRSTLWG